MTRDWHPIYDVPPRLKMGATVMLRKDRHSEPVRGFWQDGGPNAGKWVTEDDHPIRASQYAELHEDE